MDSSTISIEASGDLIILQFRGKIGVPEMDGYIDKVKQVTGGMTRGFKLLTDLTELESMDLACTVFIKKAMDICRAGGVSSIVRVIPDPGRDIGFNIMSLFHYPRSVQIITCETREEAERVLGLKLEK